MPVAASGLYNLPRYPPRSAEAVDLFTAAAGYAGLPKEWADPATKYGVGLYSILDKESQGWVGIPNYHFGNYWGGQKREEWPVIWAALKQGLHRGAWRTLLNGVTKDGQLARDLPHGQQSSASGLGQLTLSNIESGNFYPSGVNGIGVPLEEAIGMLRYIRQRHTDPAKAWENYNKKGEGY